MIEGANLQRGFMDWKRILGYISGSVNEELLLRIEYLVSENSILKGQIKGRILLSDAERKTLAQIGKRLGRKALEEIASIVKPETILGWHRQLIARQFDGSKNRTYPGRPRTDAELETLIVRMAQENRSWGYDRIVGALANLGYRVSDNTVGNILKRNGLAPAPERKKTTTWKEFIRTHEDLLFGMDFSPPRCGPFTDSSLFMSCFHSGQQSEDSYRRNHASSERELDFRSHGT